MRVRMHMCVCMQLVHQHAGKQHAGIAVLVHAESDPDGTRAQEEELQQREQDSATSARQLAELQTSATAAEDARARAEAVNGDLRGKLEDSKQQLQGNEQMIRWLNAQVWSTTKRDAFGSTCASSLQTQPD